MTNWLLDQEDKRLFDARFEVSHENHLIAVENTAFYERLLVDGVEVDRRRGILSSNLKTPLGSQPEAKTIEARLTSSLLPMGVACTVRVEGVEILREAKALIGVVGPVMVVALVLIATAAASGRVWAKPLFGATALVCYFGALISLKRQGKLRGMVLVLMLVALLCGVLSVAADIYSRSKTG